MRKSFNGLSAAVKHRLGENPLSGHLYVFINRRRTQMKILYFDRTDYAVWNKRLESEQFRWPVFDEQTVSLTVQQLNWLLDGIDLTQWRPHRALQFEPIA